MSESKAPDFDFGIIIAFVAPGLIGLRAAGYLFPSVEQLMSSAADKEQSVGLFLFVLLASLALGLVVSGIRDILVDSPLRLKVCGRQLVQPLLLDWSKGGDTKLTSLLTIRDNHYRYYQFYANTAVALTLWALAYRASAQPALSAAIRWAIAVVILLLLWAAKRALQRYVEGVRQLLS